jgi:protein-S-isoprenylcysteine O-methyltransferase Ste14
MRPENSGNWSMSKITKSIWATSKGFVVMELVIIYLRLAKSEFGQAYLDYLQRTPVWFPTFFQPQLSQKPT